MAETGQRRVGSLSERFDWICDRCRELIADGTGSVSVAYADIQRARAERWQAMELLLSAGMLRTEDDWADFLVYKPQARWTVRHRACDRRSRPLYWIPVEQLRSRRDFISWTSHLVRKPWLLETDWLLLMAEMNSQLTGMAARHG